MTHKLIKSFQYGFAVLAVLAVAYVFSIQSIVFAGAPSGLQATVATTSANAVGTTATMLFATSTCSARIVTTAASPVMLTFSDYANQTPTGSFGHLQAASTTVSYDGGVYGCGKVKAYAFVASTITLTETR